MRDVYICATVYHLLIALIKQLLSTRSADLIICKRSNISEITIDRIEKSNLFRKVYIYDDIEICGYQIGWIEKILKGKKNAKEYFISLSSLPNNFWENKEIYIFNDNSFFGKWFNQFKIRYHLLEDGLNHYAINPLKQQPKYAFIHKLLGVFCGHHGFATQMIDLEVNSTESIPQSLQKKAFSKSRRELFQKLSSQQKDLLIYLFDAKQFLNIISKPTNTDTTLLITQPLSEDSIISHRTKISIYKELIEKYGHGQIFIKPHPRETEDYNSIFKGCSIIRLNKIPLEILDLFPNFKFTYGITAFSTALESLNNVKYKIFMGYDWTVNHE